MLTSDVISIPAFLSSFTTFLADSLNCGFVARRNICIVLGGRFALNSMSKVIAMSNAQQIDNHFTHLTPSKAERSHEAPSTLQAYPQAFVAGAKTAIAILSNLGFPQPVVEAMGDNAFDSMFGLTSAVFSGEQCTSKKPGVEWEA